MQLIAKTDIKYPPTKAGERFETSERAARALKLAGKAMDVSAGEGELPLQQQRKRGSGNYKRRDMRAED